MKRSKIKQEDIAQAVGVSVSTVSRVLSGAPGISTATIEKVLTVAAEMGTPLPAGVANRPVRNESGLKRALLFISQADVHGGTGSIYHFVASGIRQAAMLSDLSVEFALLNEEGFVPDKLLGRGDTGILFAGVDPSPDAMSRIKSNGNPVVLVNALDPTMAYDHVAPNNLYGGRLAAQHLVEMGHRRIMHIGTKRRWTLRARTEGFQQGILDAKEAGVTCDYFPMQNISELEAQAILARIPMENGFPYTAIFCTSDNVALSSMQSLRLRGLDVPNEVSVLGFNGLPISEFSSPLLSTLSVDWEYLGTEAIRLLLQRHAEPTRPTQQTQIQVSLKTGNSVAKLS